MLTRTLTPTPTLTPTLTRTRTRTLNPNANPNPHQARRRGSFLRAPLTGSKEAEEAQTEGEGPAHESVGPSGKVKRSESFGRVSKRFKRAASFGRSRDQ